ncbi:MAG: hypothetical protein IK088_09315, partial [Lachnospiraceae bacterium]|nr:hypothetical protein [Lachnospiraceae bacterium]
DAQDTEIHRRMYEYDSLLLYLEPAKAPADRRKEIPVPEDRTLIRIPPMVPYSLSEPNALLLDQAEYALDDGPWNMKEEILRLDDLCRSSLGWPSRKESVAQPWTIRKEPVTHRIRLRWRIHSKIDLKEASLAIEDAEKVGLFLNGERVESRVNGYYADRGICTVPLPALHTGENVIEAVIPFGERTNVEWAYLIGNFGVDLRGQCAVITGLPEKLAFGSITTQGFPFYGGNVTYHIPVETPAGGLYVRTPQYRGSLLTVSLDAGEEVPSVYPPYIADLGRAEAGTHTVDLKLFGNRANGFGPVHLTDLKERWIGPQAWRTEGEKWCYEYRLKEIGVLSAPEITV